MREDIQTRLESQYASYRLVEQLHDVPPHEVYEVVVDGQRAVYKGDVGPTGKAGIEGHVMELIGEQTSVPVPEILRKESDWFLASWEPSAPSPDDVPDADEAWASAAGAGLATLHTETAPLVETYGTFHLEDKEDGEVRLTDAGYDEWHAAAVDYLRQRRPVLTEYGHADIVDRVSAFLTDRPEAFAGVDGPVCCHGWATPEHVSVDGGAVTCLLDFEHAIAAPGEFDYWRTVFPAFGPDTSDTAQRAFREGYESVRPLPAGFDRRKPFYALLNGIYYFESLHVQAQHDPEETARKAARLRTNVDDVLTTLS